MTLDELELEIYKSLFSSEPNAKNGGKPENGKNAANSRYKEDLFAEWSRRLAP